MASLASAGHHKHKYGWIREKGRGQKGGNGQFNVVTGTRPLSDAKAGPKPFFLYPCLLFWRGRQVL